MLIILMIIIGVMAIMIILFAGTLSQSHFSEEAVLLRDDILHDPCIHVLYIFAYIRSYLHTNTRSVSKLS
jgi:hypothetical protein